MPRPALLLCCLCLTFLGLGFGYVYIQQQSQERLWLDNQLNTLSVEQKVGQLLLVSSRYPQQSTHILTFFKTKPLSGIITYGKSKTAEHLISLSNNFSKLFEEQGLPFWLSMDHEGRGLLSEGTAFPRQLVLESIAKPKTTYKMAQIIGTELSAVGINLVFAPVLDVNLNPKNPVIGARSFSSQAKKAAKHASAYTKGMLSTGVLPVGKHFPGHGRSSQDSHLELPVIAATEKQLLHKDIKPFKTAIKAGLPGIMTAHVLYPELDHVYPATLSRFILNILLRKKLKFTGFTISDAMNMKGVSDFSSLKQNVLNSILAGVDIAMLVDNSIEEIESVYDFLIKAVHTNALSMQRLNEAVARILIAKKRAGLYEAPSLLSLAKAQEILKHPTHLEFAQKIRKQGVLIKHKSPSKKLKISQQKVLIVTDTKAKIELYSQLLSTFKPKAITHFKVEKTLSHQARLKLWGKYINFKKKNNTTDLQNFYNGNGLSPQSQKKLLKAILNSDIVFADIQTRTQAKTLNALAQKVKTPIVGLYFNTRLDSAYYHLDAQAFAAHMIGFSQTQALLKEDIKDAFDKLH